MTNTTKITVSPSLIDEDKVEYRRQRAHLRSECAANWALAKKPVPITMLHEDQAARDAHARQALAALKAKRRLWSRLLKLLGLRRGR